MLLFLIPEIPHETQAHSIKQTIKNLWLPLKFPAFRWYLIFNAAIETVLILLPVLLPFYLKFYLESFDLLPFYALVLALSAVLTIVFFLRKKNFCKIVMFRLGAILAALGIAGLYFVPEETHYLVMLPFFLIGAAVAALSSARLSMLTDLADVISRENQTSMQAFIFTLAKGSAKVIAGLVVVTVLSFSDIAPKEADILPVELRDLKLLLVVPCVILLVTAFISSCFYRMDEKNI
jgi:Na+/melibiose symporter-like transporter